MGRLFKLVFYVAILMLLGLVGFSFLGDLSVPQKEIVLIIEPDES